MELARTIRVVQSTAGTVACASRTPWEAEHASGGLRRVRTLPRNWGTRGLSSRVSMLRYERGWWCVCSISKRGKEGTEYASCPRQRYPNDESHRDPALLLTSTIEQRPKAAKCSARIRTHALPPATHRALQ